jgi:serine/threonine protein kinase
MGTPMESSPTTDANKPLAAQFDKLWEAGGVAPDVFAFLSSHPGLAARDRLELLLIDQRRRWLRGQQLPLRVYLSACPDIAGKSEMIRVLVDRDREHRRQSFSRVDASTASDLANVVSQAATERIEPACARQETEADPAFSAPNLSETRSMPFAAERDKTTGEQGGASGPEERLSFAVDDDLYLQSEAESLREMLNSVRFTLVRRLGAGGMGVVWEAYDQQRSELVALKTMRRIDPSALVRFKQEFRGLSDISHSNLVNLYELFAVKDRWFFTMELVEGCDFLTFVRSEQEREAASSRGSGQEGGLEGSAGITTSSSRVRVPAVCRLFDETRLRESLCQLAEGVEALHQAGKLHRDIKPTNVLVTIDGRVVILDFGLTADLASSSKHQPGDRQIVGTLGHMSPEQAAGLPTTPASDWYSVGVILFESMTARLPFDGPAEDILTAKRTQAAPSLASIVPGLPDDLARLCEQLLSRDPSQRPSGREIIAILSGQRTGVSEVFETNRPPSLIGRSRHRQVLTARFASLAPGRTESVFVFGRTGTGKSTLVRSFLDELVEKDEAVVLSGRCYERESVPYKALDSLIDSLARYLKGLPPHKGEALLPRDVAFLARLFPALQSVDAVAAARRIATEVPDQQEYRRLAVAALRELLGRIATTKGLILAIDDLQWGDVDSAILLSDLVCLPNSPALLLIGCFRLEDAEQSVFLREIRRSIAQAPGNLHHRELAVEPLTQAESREMALALLGRDDAVSRAFAHMVARESRGNPLFIDELVKHIQSGGWTDRSESIGEIDLDEVLWARIKRQPEEASRLLATIAVSGRPIRQSLAFQAAELGAGGRVALASLRTARLVRRIGPTQEDEVEIYHGRIRESVVSHLGPEALKRHHERLARVLEADGNADPEVLAEHLQGSGDRARASEYYLRAADHSTAALAFDHAARLYRIALELHLGPPDQICILWKKLGDSLANGGRGAEAASAYKKAAESTTASETSELMRLATSQLLLSGHLDEGLALLRTILGPLGLGMPSTIHGALLSLCWNRALLRLRGLRFQRREPSQVSPRDLSRIDLCWSAVVGLSMNEPLRGADFQARGLLLALRTGEPYRIARALAMEAGHRSTAGLSAAPGVVKLLENAESLAEQIDSPHARGITRLVRGTSSLMLGQWKAAQTYLDEADQLFRNRCTGVSWERDTVHNFLLWALLQMGELAELRRRWIDMFREAQERGDLYAANMLTSLYMTVIKLAANEAPDSEAQLEATAIPQGGRPFNLQNSTAFDGLISLYFYRGDFSTAWNHIRTMWPEYSRSMLIRIQMIRINVLEQRSRSALAMAERAKQPTTYLRQAKLDARQLNREKQRWALAHAAFVRAGIAACEEQIDRAVTEMNLAVQLYDEADMPLRAQVLRYRLGEVLTDATSRARRQEAEIWMRNQGIISPVRWAGMYAPGFAKISNELMETSF